MVQTVKIFFKRLNLTTQQNTSLILVRLFLSRSVWLLLLGQSPSLEAQSQSVRLRPGYDSTVWESKRPILWWLSSSVLQWYCDMKCHARLFIIMPRSHSHVQEGCTRCASTCGRHNNWCQYWHGWALEFCSGSSRRVSAAGAGSKLMLASSRAGEFSTGSFFGLTHCASCSTLVCLHSSQPSAKGRNSQKQEMYHIHLMCSTYFETHANWVLA